MHPNLHTFSLNPDWRLINALSAIDRFDGAWKGIERQEGHTLKQLKDIATVQSVGASTRIEGSRLSDNQIEKLLLNINIAKLEDRDQQEVAGYFQVMDEVSESWENIRVSENSIRHLHNMLLKQSEKDSWHRGNYKLHANHIQGTQADGTKTIIFTTTPPGFETEDAMRNLLDWYKTDKTAHPLVKCAVMTYEFLTIHPFQDGNGRMSRLISTLLLLKAGYNWIQYISFENEIERRKQEYYQVLIACQQQRPGEDIYPWVMFFLTCLETLSKKLMRKLSRKGSVAALSQRHRDIFRYIENYPGAASGQISDALNIPLPTVKKDLESLMETGLLIRHGKGRGTNYTAV